MQGALNGKCDYLRVAFLVFSVSNVPFFSKCIRTNSTVAPWTVIVSISASLVSYAMPPCLTLYYAFHAHVRPGSLFHVLREELGVSLECFASPLNCYFGRYCSAFRDLDPCFGSLGSFFDFHPTEVGRKSP
jgi:hypothetical protein